MITFPVSKIEKRITLLIARSWRRPYLDGLMIWISDPYKWMIPMLVFALCLIYIDWQSGLKGILLGSLGAGLSDTINAKFIKPKVDRIRPGKQLEEIESLGTMNRGKKSFPSNHASNTTAFTLAIGIFFPATLWILVPMTLLVSYSRVYCGAHYPLDVLGGWFHASLWIFLLHSWIFSQI